MNLQTVLSAASRLRGAIVGSSSGGGCKERDSRSNNSASPELQGQGQIRVMRCPRCSTELEPYASEGIQLDRCRLCFGTWFDRGELAKFNHFDSDFPLAPGRAIQGQPAHIRCPRCRGALIETPYDAGLSVIIERCADCEGVWLDGDDIAHVREVMLAQGRVSGKAARRLQQIVQRERALMKRREAWLAAQEKSGEQGSVGKWLFTYLTALPVEVHHPVQRFPKVTVGLIAANMLAFGLELLARTRPGGQELILAFGLVPDQLRHGQHLWDDRDVHVRAWRPHPSLGQHVLSLHVRG
jgi:uncharacterized protein